MSTCPSSNPTCARIRVLLVDDDETFRASLAGILRDDGHDVLDFPSPIEIPPLAVLGDVGVLITDFSMPGRDGLSLADEFHALHPGVPVILVTAYRTATVERNAVDRDFLSILTKPLEYEALHTLLHRLASAAPAPIGH